jgi:NADH:ubiquinone oxidoreductase subunit 4 (subunit M)
MFRLLLSTFSNLYYDLMFFIFAIALLGLTYASMLAFNQIDIKKIIAYSSISHMNFSLLGLFSQTLLGLNGCFIMMFGHAITSSALFLGVGILYDRYKTRLIFYYGGLVLIMPLFTVAYFLCIISNFGFPGTLNFVGEFFILLGGFFFSDVFIVLSCGGLILSLVYSLFLFNRVFFGPISVMFIRYYSDISRLESFYLLLFIGLVLLGGIYPITFFELS